MHKHRKKSKCQNNVIKAAIVASVCGFGVAAQAQVSRGFIAPHEYALPVDFKPFNIFVEYVTLQDSNQTWNASGEKESTGNTKTIVALSKYVRLWTPESNPKLGLAWEVIVPKVGVRDKAAGSSTGGIADPITGAAIWFKPKDNLTIGADLFVQVPIGDQDVGGGDRWNVIGSIFWDGQFDKLNYTANLGFNFPGAPTAGVKPGKVWHMNHRLGYRATDLLEPYVGFDYERQQGGAANPKNHESVAAVGLLFHTYKHSNIALHYEKGLDGKSRAVSDNLNVRFVYSW